MDIKKILADHAAWLAGEGGERANLSGVDLRGVDLRGVDLRGVDLSGANLSGANLSGANLSLANLSGANLRGADLIVIHLPVWSVYIHAETIRIGCKYHTHREWKNFTDDEIGKMDRHALDWCKQYKPLIMAGVKSLKSKVCE